jgi:response regulator RpfG family c-di-GMP phosphodiesterase
VSSWKTHRKEGEGAEPSRLTLLIVDDEKRILESLTELLGDRYRVVTAQSGEQALEVFAKENPELVLCDQRMPGSSGIETLKRIREMEPGTIRLLITGYSDIEVVIEAVNDQVLHRYITKPWVNEDLLAVVAEGAKRYLEESGMTDTDAGILF